MPIVYGNMIEFRITPSTKSTMECLKDHILEMDRLGTEQDVDAAREALNHLRSLIHQSDHTIGYRMSPGGIMNAYREGDIGFEEAIARLRQAYELEKTIQANK